MDEEDLLEEENDYENKNDEMNQENRYWSRLGTQVRNVNLDNI